MSKRMINKFLKMLYIFSNELVDTLISVMTFIKIPVVD